MTGKNGVSAICPNNARIRFCQTFFPDTLFKQILQEFSIKEGVVGT